MLGMFRRRTVCSCSERSANWSWPFTRAHERYHDATVTTVTCLKHHWSVRLYDPKTMSFVKSAEERKIVRPIQANTGQTQPSNVHDAGDVHRYASGIALPRAPQLAPVVKRIWRNVEAAN